VGSKVLEKTVTKACFRYLETISNSHFEKRVGTIYTRDRPDISGCIAGRRVEIELKAPGEEPTHKQTQQLDTWERAGAVVVRGATSVAEVKAILEKHFSIGGDR